MKTILGLFFLLSAAACFGQPLGIWYDKPASVWEGALPLGNGRLGMMPDGGVRKETIVLNEITLWSGSPQDANNYDAYKSLPDIRKLLFEGRNDEAQRLVDANFICKGPGSRGAQWGCYQTMGTLVLDFSYGRDSVDSGRDPVDSGRGPVDYSAFARGLSLDSAIAFTGFTVDGVAFRREYFTSFSGDVGVIRITADRPGRITCALSLNRPERAAVTASGDIAQPKGQLARGGIVQMEGQLDNGVDGKGMRYLAKARVVTRGGSVQVKGGRLVVSKADELLIYVSMGTDFNPTLGLVPGAHPDAAYRERVDRLLAEAVRTPYVELRRRHVAAFRALFDRVAIRLGGAGRDDLPTDIRLQEYQRNPGADNGLAALFFQYGRYLSISSTRVGLLPPNLQGLWANQVHTPWNGDYHLDVNVEMNHWPVDVANLSELDLPLADLVARMVPYGERSAKAYYHAGGWVAHVITNPWHFTEPGESASWGASKAGSGWLCNNLWQHFVFTDDTAYLRRIYPILRGAALFYHDMLIRDPATGWLVTSPSSSPENGFKLPNGQTASICMGPTIDNQIVRELYDNVIQASTLLKTDGVFRDTLVGQLKQMPPPGRVASDGRMMEWLQEYAETEVHHRHISHLYGLYPGSLITPDSTPDLAAACAKTLDARGDDGPGWSIAYKMLMWARLYDGDRAYKLFKTLMRPTLATNMNYGAGGGIYPNLFSAGPPFQIDANFGGEAAIAEMLLQSHAGYINLLPAIPAEWKAEGEVRGLKARGDIVVDFRWKDGKVVSYRVRSRRPQVVKIKMNGVIEEVQSESFAQLPFSDYFTPRSGLKRFYTAVNEHKKATVGFLGGSITFNPGWREKVCAYLTARFPGTDFRFIAAGIPSLGSLPHAFRVRQDLLDSGRIDLLFLETAVNDRVNGTDSLTQVRCLEGIVRQVKKADPGVDIIMMAFADPDKTADYDRGIVPTEIANQELVAGHYGLPSINLGKEVHDKLRNKEFDWKLDFRDIHPSPFGQELYFENIKQLLDTCLKLYPGPHPQKPLPAPLDDANLEHGRYEAVSQAHHDSAWILSPDWAPADSVATRPGFVHVPVLVGAEPGAQLTFTFEGTAVGMAVVSGPDAGIVEYEIDNGPWQPVNLYTKWSGMLHLPWFILFGSGLAPGRHVLQLRISGEKDPDSNGYACRIVHFLVEKI